MALADDILVYNSGAHDLDEAQTDESLSLGGFRSSSITPTFAYKIINAIHCIKIVHISGACGEGVHGLVAVEAGAVQFAAAGEAPGTKVAISNGETKTVYSSTSTKYIIVKREYAGDLAGSSTIATAILYNNPVSMDDALVSDGDDYRLVVFRNRSASPITGIKLWVDASSTGLALALDEADGDGCFRDASMDGEESLPTGSLSFSAPVSEGSTGLIFALAPGALKGLWLRRSIPDSGTSGGTLQRIHYSFDGKTQTLAGKYRLADPAQAGYLLYRGVDSPVDFSSPWATFPALPYESSALAPSHTYKFVTRYRNAYGYISQNIDEYEITLDAEGDIATDPPSAPQEISITPAGNNKFLVEAIYYYEQDDEDVRADTWLIYTDAADDPNPSLDTPITQSMTLSGGMARLSYKTSAYPDETTLRLLVRTRNAGNDKDSINTDIYSTVNTGAITSPDVACIFVSKTSDPNNLIVWFHDHQNYIEVDINGSVMRFVIGGNVVAGITRAGILYIDGELIESAYTVETTQADLIVYDAGKIKFGLGLVMPDTVAELNADGDLTVFKLTETPTYPSYEFASDQTGYGYGYSGYDYFDTLESFYFYDNAEQALKFSTDREKTYFEIVLTEEMGVTNGNIRVKGIRQDG